MNRYLDLYIVRTIASRTFKHFIESPIAYVVCVFYYGFVGGVFGFQFFQSNHASIEMLGTASMWVLWFFVPALTMGLLSEELRSGTFEGLSTLPVRDWEIVVGKFLGFAFMGLILMGGLIFFPISVSWMAAGANGIDWGASMGLIGGQFLLLLAYGAIGLFSSSLSKNQVVAFILGMVFCTILFFLGQFSPYFPPALSGLADFLGVLSHLNTMGRGVWDVRDLLYFLSLGGFFLYMTVQKLESRKF